MWEIESKGVRVSGATLYSGDLQTSNIGDSAPEEAKSITFNKVSLLWEFYMTFFLENLTQVNLEFET